MVKYADRITSLPPYIFAEVDRVKHQKIKEGVDIIDLGVGDPDMPTPDYVIDSLCKAAHDPETHQYPSYSGSTVFRDAAVDWFKKRFGVSLNAENEIITLIGSKEGIAHIPSAFVNVGDYTLCPNPAYPAYSIGTTLADGKAYDMPLLAENGFKPDLSKIPSDIVKKSKMIFINYPNNPTAATADKKFFKEVIDFGKDNGIVVVHDNAYSEVTYDGYNSPSILEVPGAMDCCIEIPFVVEDVEHDRLAHRLRHRQRRHRRRPGQGQDERRLGRFPGGPDGGHRRAQAFGYVQAENEQDIQGAARRAARRPLRHGYRDGQAQGYVLRLGSGPGQVYVHGIC